LGFNFEQACANTVSPDGRWQLGVERGGSDEAGATWYAFDLERGSYVRIGELSTETLLGWLPDSRRFLVARGEKLSLVDRESGKISPAGSVKGSYPALSPDGRTLVVPGDANQGDIWMMEFVEENAAGKENRRSR
jgi:hypothetical protein